MAHFRWNRRGGGAASAAGLGSRRVLRSNSSHPASPRVAPAPSAAGRTRPITGLLNGGLIIHADTRSAVWWVSLIREGDLAVTMDSCSIHRSDYLSLIARYWATISLPMRSYPDVVAWMSPLAQYAVSAHALATATGSVP
jgi:hypothetical protein